MPISNHAAAHLKLKLLSRGVRFSSRFLDRFSKSPLLMHKRRAYNTSDSASLPRSTRIPQEIFLNGVVVSVNFREESPWCLDVSDDGRFFLLDGSDREAEITIKDAPKFLELKTSKGVPCGSVANLYGGSSLAFFTPATCYLFANNTECRFCSLAPTRQEEREFISTITPGLAGDVLDVAQVSDEAMLGQIMLVGGNLRNYDRGFLRHVEIARELNRRQEKLPKENKLKTHIATMPPNNLTLLDELADLDCHITMNLEVFDPRRFEEVAPGKAADYGRSKLLQALELAAKKAPPKSVHTILIAGLEPPAVTISGIRQLPELGVTPILNVLHSDRGTLYEHFPRPQYEELLEIALALEETYQKYGLIPYWKGCGRNALDFEAQNRWFRH
jgi:hypothetical protein